MAEVILPAIDRTLRAVVVTQHDVGGERLHAVTIWQGSERPAKRRWFASRAIALAHAADRSDEHNLLLIDISGRAGDAE